MGNKKVLRIVLIVVTVLVLVLGGYVLYKGMINKDSEKTNKTDNKISYQIYDLKDNIKGIKVNGESAPVAGNKIEVVGEIDNLLIIKTEYENSYNVYALNDKAKLVKVFMGKTEEEIKEDIIFLKERKISDCTIENNTIVFVSQADTTDVSTSVCGMNGTDPFQYKEKVTYSDNQFSIPELVETVTAENYISSNKVECE